MPGAQPYAGGYQAYGPQVMANPFESRASTVLILGILGLVLCGPILGPIAWYQGNSLRRDATAAGYPEPGNAKAGRICGMIGTIMSLLGILLYVVVFAVAMSSSSSGY